VTARAQGTRKGQRADRAEERALLELLSHGLSEEEIQRVLTCALLALDERGRDRLLARLGEETGGTLRRLLVSHGRSRTKAQPPPGSAKVQQIYPGDAEHVMSIPYYVDRNIFWDRGDLFERPVKATLYRPGFQPVTLERCFESFQIF
jgi:hypothetical protein